MIYIKSDYDLKLIKQAASIWKQVKAMLIENCKAGVSLITLDEKANDLITKLGGQCSFYQYNEFPKHICISVNDELIHGVPNNYIIQDGDLISFDVGVTYNHHICDSAFSVVVGNNPTAEAINQATYEALMEAIKVVKPNNSIGDISNAISEVATKYGYEVIKDYGGHGCGIKLHEDPMILNYGEPHSGSLIQKGMTLCIEPMLMSKSDKYYIDKKNNWTVISKNHLLTCHWEHMVYVNDNGCEILTN